MKYFAYILIMLLLISITTLFYLKRPDGKSWLSADQISQTSTNLKTQAVALSNNTLDEAVKLVTSAHSNMVNKVKGDLSSSTVIYKWQDQHGQWHYSDQPNPHGYSEKVILDPNDITVVEAEDTSILKGSAKSGELVVTQNPANAYNPVVIKKLFDEAEQVKEKLAERNEQLQKAQ
ncbi:DUF4124 domain-containing protein [Pseudoalteromonas sp. H105]|uniref:DUF4124 domain-containing protein n=1 Tax=Pseudoalteromonas sp. H105 TaxID=1348393 RepID=UPI00073200B8|nr:DUF4124 domain-containing protein [Pseudoalteromonas sp. H105]KTF13964.1 hypothetical protein ATS75_12620 [Pseudoalteromonas sp. H105]